MISKSARIIEKVFSMIGTRSAVSKMICNPKRNNRYAEPPKSFFRKFIIQCNTICGRKCYSLKTSASPKKHIFYFHGGAYTLQAQRMHWRIIGILLAKTQCQITNVNYPLAPECTCADTLAMVIEAYALLSNNSERETILMGDSAGGGLALALAQQIKSQGLLPKPEKIILLSPWLDISMDKNLTREQEERDLVLAKETLLTVGKSYAGNYDARDYRCSPLYGEITDIGDIALFTGTSEILNVQARQLRDELTKQGQSISYFEYEQMQHVWIGLPIPEAKKALDQVISFIQK